MYRKTMRVAVFVLVLCTSFGSFAQVKMVVEDSVMLRHQDFKASFERFDKKFKPKLNGKYITKTNFKQIANQTQFLVEKKKISKLFGVKSVKKQNLATTYDKLVEMSKKKKIDIGIDYVVTGTPSLIRKSNSYYTYKTTAAMTIEAVARSNEQTSTTKNELTLLWIVAMDDLKGKGRAKTIHLTSIKAKSVSGFFEYEKRQMQKIAENLIEKYYQNLLSAEWNAVLLPDVPNKHEIENLLKSSNQIDTAGAIRVPLPNSQIIIVGEGNVPTINIHVAEGVVKREQRFALTFHIKIKDCLTSGEITKVVYRQLDTYERPMPVSEPEPEVQQPEIVEKGLTYKVQILALYTPTPLAELSKEYRNVENVVIEESIINGRTYYQYVIPVGNNAKEAQALKNKLIAQGIKEAWIVKYKDGKRITPKTK